MHTRPEKKQITVLFCDIADYTMRITQQEPEETAEDILEFQNICQRAAKTYNGYIAQYLGDAAVILFGYPRVTEFDAANAINTGMEIISLIGEFNNAIQSLNRKKIHVRIGIATSLVYIQEPSSSSRLGEFMVGEAPNLAARLQEIANQNAILVAPRTYALTSDLFYFEGLETRHFKGFNTLIKPWKVTASNHFRDSRKPRHNRELSPFHGRHEELIQLNRHLSLSLKSIVQHVLITGEPGIGKSRLIRVFESHLTKQEFSKVRINCSPFLTKSAFQPIINELTRWNNLSGVKFDIQKQVALTQSLSANGIYDNQSLVLLLELMSVPLPPHIPPFNANRTTKREKLIELMHHFILQMSRQRPVLLLVEDVHWIDQSTLTWLQKVLATQGQHRIFTIISARGVPEYLNGKNVISTIKLNRLNRKNSTALANNILQKSENSIASQHIEKVLQCCDGIPLFIEEMSWSLIEQIKAEPGTPNHTISLNIPATLQGFLNERLDQFGEAKTTLQLASVFGNDFHIDDLIEIGSYLTADIHSDIDLLLSQKILRYVAPLVHNQLRFSHNLIQEAAYYTIVKNDKIKYHLAIAERLESQRTTTQYELIAHHYTSAKAFVKAIPLWLKAGQEARKIMAYDEALNSFYESLKCIERENREKFSRQELEIRLNIANCLIAIHGYYSDEIYLHYRKADDLANRLHDYHMQSVANYGLWRCHIFQAQLTEATKVAAKIHSLNHALPVANHYTELISRSVPGMMRMMGGEFKSAEKHFAVAMNQYVASNDNDGIIYGQDPYVALQALQALNHLLLHNSDKSIGLIEKAIGTARQNGHPYTIAEALRLGCIFMQHWGDTVALSQYANEIIEISEHYQFSGLHACAQIFTHYAMILNNNGDTSKHLDIIEENIKIYQQKYGYIFAPYLIMLSAIAKIKHKKFLYAAISANDAIEIAKTAGEYWLLAPALCIKATAAELGVCFTESEIDAWRNEANDIAKKQQAQYFQARYIHNNQLHELLK